MAATPTAATAAMATAPAWVSKCQGLVVDLIAMSSLLCGRAGEVGAAYSLVRSLENIGHGSLTIGFYVYTYIYILYMSVASLPALAVTVE